MKINIMHNVMLNDEELDRLILDLQELQQWKSSFIPPKSHEQPKYNAAMDTKSVHIEDDNCRITIWKFNHTKEEEDAVSDMTYSILNK